MRLVGCFDSLGYLDCLRKKFCSGAAEFFFVHGQKYAKQSVCSCLFCFVSYFFLFYKKILCMYDGWLTRRYCFSNWEGLGILLTIWHTSDHLTYFWLSHSILLTILWHTSDHLAYFWPCTKKKCAAAPAPITEYLLFLSWKLANRAGYRRRRL